MEGQEEVETVSGLSGTHCMEVRFAARTECLLLADTVEKVREPAVIGLFGSIWRHRGKLVG